MTRSFHTLAAIVIALHSVAQVDLPVFGRQDVINGYAKDIEGEVLSYFSVYPEHATTALLTRCTDGKKAIAWETAPTPFVERESIQYFYFSWIAAHNSTTSGGDRSFDLYINDQLALTFTTHHNTKPGTWSATAADSTKLVFEFSKMDRHGDAHGFAHLRVPRKFITLGQPVKLKVVGHAQDSPDWFMTFRYTFEEKVEVEVLPFTAGSAQWKQHPILVSVMHFGGLAQLEMQLPEAKEPFNYPINNGLNEFELRVEAKPFAHDIPLRVKLNGRVLLDTLLHVEPVIHREIHLIHHSHNDIGYSHLQSEVEVIQNNNIRQALDIIDRTRLYHTKDSRFVWNVESLWAVENFLGKCTEQDKHRFISAVKSGSIALSANYANILTGLCTPEEMHWIVEYADSLRKWYDLPINSAMQTDIPGMSWSMVDAYAAHGIRYLSQGPNYIPDLPDGGDRIGSTLREQGDKPYWWKSTTGKDSILVWTAGQGYGGWHGFRPGAIKERGKRKIAAYMNELASKGYPYDMVQWRYNIVSDNGPVDNTLSAFVDEWNRTYSSPRLIISNVNEMMTKFDLRYGKQIPSWSGDFTPYWEDGAYSTAKEEGDVRLLSARLTNLIEAAKILNKPIDPHLLYRAKRSIVMWHEHTWGAWCSISDPDAHFTTDQWRVKKAFADSAGWYVGRIEAALLPTTEEGRLWVLNALDYQRASLIRVTDGKRTAVKLHDGRHPVDSQRDYSGFEEFNVLAGKQSMRRHSLKWGKRKKVESTQGEPPKADLLPYAMKYVTGLSGDSITDGHVDCVEGLSYGRLVDRKVGHGIISGALNFDLVISVYPRHVHAQFVIKQKKAVRDKESLHLALPFNIPSATVRIGIGDTCITPESGRIPGSNNDFFCAQRWIDVSNDSMGVTIVCPQGAIWEVGEMVDERKVNPGRGSNPELYKAWKTEAKSSSTIYLYALNNYWHTNFKADQEGPITFDLYLKMHGPFKLEDARRFGLEMTRPLITWWK